MTQEHIIISDILCSYVAKLHMLY